MGGGGGEEGGGRRGGGSGGVGGRGGEGGGGGSVMGSTFSNRSWSTRMVAAYPGAAARRFTGRSAVRQRRPQPRQQRQRRADLAATGDGVPAGTIAGQHDKLRSEEAMKRRTILKAPSAAAVMAVVRRTGAAWPSRPITLYVPFAAGGPRTCSAASSREACRRNSASRSWSRTRAAWAACRCCRHAKAAPDGYTIGMNATGPSAIAPFMVPACRSRTRIWSC